MKVSISEMYCTKCGKRGISIPRKDNSYREPGHLKKIYCIYCNKEQNHVEIRPLYGDYNYNDFQLEMKYNNFDEEGNRKESYKTFRAKLIQKEII